MQLIDNDTIKFDQILPIYNWFYPLVSSYQEPNHGPAEILDKLNNADVRSRALYFHVPFCSSFCAFCPFVKMIPKNKEVLHRYTDALIREIQLKANHKKISEVPITAIFFGGGTPTTLPPDDLRRLCQVIRKHFDLSQLMEFSMEMSAAHMSDAMLSAMLDVGVTHPRFGVQTFQPYYRKLLDLTTTIEQIQLAATVLPKHFPHPSFDMMYGLNGQNEEEFFEDIETASSIGMHHIAFYPINNIVTPLRLHEKYEAEGLRPVSGLTKVFMNVVLREYLRAAGYLPHNGYEFIKASDEEVKLNPVVTESYIFQYHKHIYGYADHELIGFGSNAISTFNGTVLNNETSIEQYIRIVLCEERLPFRIRCHPRSADASKGVIMHLPFYGHVEKKRINWNSVYPETCKALDNLIKADLIRETDDRFELTHEGWYWYFNIIYYLCPAEEQIILERFIANRRREVGRRVEPNGIV